MVEMPTYCFKNDNGETYEKVFPASEAPDVLLDNLGGKWERDRQAEAAGMTTCVKGSENPVRRHKSPWPMEPCIGSGVHPDQAQELRDHLSVRGCPTEIDKEGNPVYISAAHRRKALKIRGMHDRNSYF